MEKKCLVIPWISLYCLLMGMFHNFCWAFGCQVRYGRHILPFLLISAIVLFCVVQLKRKYAVMVSVAGVMGLVGYIWLNFELLTSDFLKVVYHINLRSREYDGSQFFPFDGTQVIGNAMDENVLIRIILIIFAVFISLFLFRIYSRGYGFVPVYIVMALGLLVGRAPSSKAVTYLVAGAVLALMWIARQESGGKRFFVQKGIKKEFGLVVYFVFAGILFVGIITAKQIGKNHETAILKNADEYLAKQHQMERVVKRTAEELGRYIKGQFSVESDGKLDNEAPHYSDDTIIKVTMAQKPTEDIYLKGFVGGEYQNGEWLPCDTEDFMSYALNDGYVKDFWNAGYQFFDYYIFERRDIDELWSYYSSESKLSEMLIEYVGKGKFGSYAYVPYHANIHSIVDKDSKDAVMMDGENGMLRESDNYFVWFFQVGMKDYPTVKKQLKAASWQMFSADGKEIEQEYNTLLELNGRGDVYSDYVRNNYSELPDKLSALKFLAYDQKIGGTFGTEPVMPVNALEAGLDVARIVKRQAVYSFDLEPVPAGQDYAEYFLFEQKKGYCEHFATAGTLLLRAKGVPARFVQGYRVDADAFEANGDGTYTANVLDSNAHAWTEVFEGEYAGWFPIEMTPAADEPDKETTQTTAPAFNTVEPSVVPEEGDKVTSAPATKKPTTAPKQNTDKDAAVQAEKKDGGLTGLAQLNLVLDKKYAFLAVGILLLLAIAVRVIQLRLRMRRYRKEFLEGENDRNLQICVRTTQLLHFLKYCGQRGLEQQNETQWCERVFCLCLERYDEKDWDELKRVMQKAAFSENSITEDEFIYYCDMVEDVECYIWKRCGKMRKCYLRILGLKK